MHKTKIRVRYCDVDRMDIVYYGKYFDYIEWARTEFLRSKGISNKEFEDKGIGLPVNEVVGKYKFPCRYDDLIEVKTFVKESKGIRLTLGYEIKSLMNDKICFEGESTHVVVDLNTMRPTRIPKEIEEILLDEGR